MTQKYEPDGDTATRDDGSEVYPVVFRDEDGKICSTHYIPIDHEPIVPGHIDPEQSQTVTVDELENSSVHEDYRNVI